ncbi:MAG: cardiolipin synthase [Lachnospiraceae bacterium]|nr:cardiolipin synthase [Lachnospiraceae bacterium]
MFKKVLGRVLIALPIIALQVFWFLLIFYLLGDFTELLMLGLQILAFLFSLYIISKRDEGSYKILWLIIIMGLPILGALLYLFIGDKGTGKKLRKKIDPIKEGLKDTLPNNTDVINEVRQKDRRIAESLNHIYETTGFPLYRCKDVTYYPFGEDMFADMCLELEKAEKFVFIEYFIVQAGKFWDTMVEILARKAAEGVDVRVMYDDVGSIATYSRSEVRQLEDKGIKCLPFNPFFFLQLQLNNRDHRKIMVIDGRVAFSGGVNIADEYINETHPFGKWKDIGFRINGEGVKSYAYMFIEFWNAFSSDRPIDKERINEFDYNKADDKYNGYILPFYDSPIEGDPTSNVFFTEVLSIATDYVYFYTPYLMLGDTLYDAFIRAANRGVDVRLILPGIPDKKMVYKISRSYYEPLLKAGVKIYEYTPGFVHAKAFVADGKLCAVGTVNLDYRSLFLHFECSSVFYDSDLAETLKKDMEDSIKESRQVEYDDTKRGFFAALGDGILRLLAPLM